ncbi:MAG: AAA family ATPase [Cyclobacteriaceae bacterium]|nr:AAA family ATPase [Cyclobacteriaceae bacterium]
MPLPKISDILSNKFNYAPTKGQKELFQLFDRLLEKNGPDALLIKGYAGTGKTTIVSTLVKILPLFNLKYLLMAPTGRAAKVLANYSERKAFTIHKIIYKLQRDRENGALSFKRIKNYHKDTVFIVDEASMIYDQYSASQSNLLRDLREYVFENTSNKLIILGDTAQLPPVGQDYSGALDKDNLERKYKLKVEEIELNEVVRQEKLSGILENATGIRQNIQAGQFRIRFNTRNYRDIFSMNSEKLEDGLRYAYNQYGIENVIIICRSNRQANQYNQYIRRNLLFHENRIDAGDHLMIVKNNYFWLDEDSPAGFLANGDFAEVLKISNTQEIYDLTFADLDLHLIDYPSHPVIRVKALLDTLESPAASLSETENKKLYEHVVADYPGLSGRELAAAIALDPYLNAIQIKFTYAITCHKSQGGQWPVVFLDQGYLKDSIQDIGYMRWLYTGMTRATRELYLVNFLSEFFNGER